MKTQVTLKELENRLTYSSQKLIRKTWRRLQCKKSEIKITAIVKVTDSRKRPRDQDVIDLDKEDRKGKKIKMSNEPILKIMDYPTSNIMLTSEKYDKVEKYIIEHYKYLNYQAKKEMKTK